MLLRGGQKKKETSLRGYNGDFDLLVDSISDVKKAIKALQPGDGIEADVDGRKIYIEMTEDGQYVNDYENDEYDDFDDFWDSTENILNDFLDEYNEESSSRKHGRRSSKYLGGIDDLDGDDDLNGDIYDNIISSSPTPINSRKTNNYSNYGFMTPREIIGSETKRLPFSGKWAVWLGLPKPNFHIVVSGQPGFGKSTLTKQFAGYLAENFGRVAYFSDEEDVSQVKEEMLRIGKESFIDNHNMLTCVRDPETKGKITFQTIRNLLKSGNFQFWFIDSLQSVGIDDKELAQLYEEFPYMGTVAISRETKNGKARGDQNKEYNDDITIRFDAVGLAKTTKNRFNKLGKFVVFETPDNDDDE